MVDATRSRARPANFRDDQTPHHRVNLRTGYKTGPYEFDIDTQYVTDYTVSGTEVESFFRVHARAAAQVDDNIVVALSGTNIDGDHYETDMAEVERRVMFSVTGTF